MRTTSTFLAALGGLFTAAAGAKAPVAKDQGASMTYAWKAHVCDMADMNQAARKTWTLRTLNGKPVVAEKPPTMMFAQGRLSIFGGVNRLMGSYALVGDTVTIGSLAGTKMAGEPALMELESDFARTLASVDGFHVHGNELEILGKGTVVATFEAGNEAPDIK